MKKFLIFLFSIVVVVSLGLTTFYFLRNDEVILVNTKEIYCNAGDVISLDSLNIVRKKPHRKTTIDYNAGGDDVTSQIKYDSQHGYYVVDQNAGGDIELVISTTNKKFKEFKVKVHIGDGVNNPYYIFNESDLSKIGSIYRLDGKSYQLMNNITLTNAFSPIGYSTASSSWIGFGGTFDGNGYTISGLNLVDGQYENAGLFSSINLGAKVFNLTVANTTITGSQYKNVGALAGVIEGEVNRVGVKNTTISLTPVSSVNVGALAGAYGAGNLAYAYADGANITLENTTALTGNNIGGLIGKLSKTTAKATYANDVQIALTNVSGNIGGYAGEFIIEETNGTIQQSYANSASTDANFAAFVGKVTKSGTFSTSANMLTHFIGNIAVVGKNGAVDTDLVKSFDNTYFKNPSDATKSAFYVADELYLIRGYETAGNIVDVNEYVFYTIDADKTLWNEYIWQFNTISLPTLTMGAVELEGVASNYFTQNLTSQPIVSADDFITTFATDAVGKKFKLRDDVDLTSGWTPVSLKDCEIDGNGYTITVDLNTAIGTNLGLFTIIDNSTIKNLNIVVTGVSSSAANVGALAGEIKSSNKNSSSLIQDVTITYQGSFGNIVATNFGGVAGKISSTNIENVDVNNLFVNEASTISYAGGIAGELTSGKINNSSVVATVYGSTYVGGVAGRNEATISNTSATVIVGYNKEVENARVGGIVGSNGGTIVDAYANVRIIITKAKTTLYVGGATGLNAGTIENVNLEGQGIAVGTETARVDGKIYVGGVSGSNQATITSTTNDMATLGTLNVGANYRVGGVAAQNSGTITQVITSSKMYGNYVGGVVAEMTSKGKIDQVLVGAYNKNTKAITSREIKGDKYVAGVAVDFRAGTISNIQAVSSLVGAASSTRTSLIVLIFPSGATLTNSTINSSMSGYGTFYRDAWTDFKDYSNKSAFGFSSSTGDSSFNVYSSLSNVGVIKSVVINAKYDDKVTVKQGMGEVSHLAWLIPTVDSYSDANGTNFIKVTSSFNNYSSFTGKFTFNSAYDSTYNSYRTTEKTLTFSIGSVWENNNGISLIFLNNIY